MKPPKPCLGTLSKPRCPEYAEPGRSRCKSCEADRRADPAYSGQRGTDPAWGRARVKALERAGYRCQRCGKSAAKLRHSSRRLDVHHVDGDSTNHALSNLRVLCGPDRGSCHRIEQRERQQRRG